MKKKLTIYCLIVMSIVMLTGCKQAGELNTEDAGANIFKKDRPVINTVEDAKKIELEVLKK